jgi:small subunit ribosomal protein S2e
MLQMGGIQDCYSMSPFFTFDVWTNTNHPAQSKGSTATQGNFLKATMSALPKTYQFQSPDLWSVIPAGLSPYDEHAAHLQIAARKAAAY